MHIGKRQVSKLRSAAIGLCLAVSAAWSQSGTWSDDRRPGSAQITALATVYSGLLAGSSFGRVFHSSDSGKSWVQSPLRAGSAIVGFLESGGILLAWAGEVNNPLADCFPFSCPDVALPGGLFRSADGGKTWTKVGPDLGVTAVTMSGNALFAIARGDMYRSADMGRTWARLAVVGPPAYYGADRMEAIGRSFIGSAYGQMSRASLDGEGVRWEGLGRGFLLTKHQGYLYAERYVPADNRFALERTLDGLSWKPVSNRRFERMFSSGDLLIGLGKDTLLASRDSGKTWTETAAGFLEGGLHRAMAEKAGTVFIGVYPPKGVLALSGDRREWLNHGMHDTPPGPLMVKNWHVLIADPARMLMTRSMIYGSLDWRGVEIDGQPARGVTHFGTLGGTVLAMGQGQAWRTDDFGRDPRLGPYAWRKDTLVGSRGAATGRGWMAVFIDGRRILLCEGEAAAVCRDGGTQPLPVETSVANPFTGTPLYYNRLLGMTATGDSLAILLDSLYVSPDRGRTFRNFGAFNVSIAWVGYHHGQIFAGRAIAPIPPETGLLRFDAALGRWEDVPLAGVKAGVRVQGMASYDKDLYLATSDGVYSRKWGRDIWDDFTEGLPTRNAVSIAADSAVMVVGLESGPVMSRWLHPISLHRQPDRPKRTAAGRTGLGPVFAAPTGSWRRLDGRVAHESP